MRAAHYLRVANVQQGWLDLAEVKTIMASEQTIATLRLRRGDILFNEGGDRDKLGRGWVWDNQLPECIHQNHVFRARLRDPRMQPRFYSWFGNTSGMRYFFDEAAQTVNLASLSKTKLSLLPVPVPSVEEQKEIVRRVSALLTAADDLRQKVEKAAGHIEVTSRSVMAKAIAGELAGVS
jgi:type I restriction enzyme S subunit